MNAPRMAPSKAPMTNEQAIIQLADTVALLADAVHDAVRASDADNDTSEWVALRRIQEQCLAIRTALTPEPRCFA